MQPLWKTVWKGLKKQNKTKNRSTMHACMLSCFSHPTLCNPTHCSPPGFSVMGFSRQEYWIGLPCPPQGNLPDPWIKPTFLMSPALTGRFFTTRASWEAQNYHMIQEFLVIHQNNVKTNLKSYIYTYMFVTLFIIAKI